MNFKELNYKYVVFLQSNNGCCNINFRSNKLNELTNKDNISKVKEKIKKIKNKIIEAENKKDLKTELKNVSLTTSKTNYIDPRITVSFIKKHNLAIELIFKKALVDKFFWAMDVSKDWIF